jgi:hypothetical protein
MCILSGLWGVCFGGVQLTCWRKIVQMQSVWRVSSSEVNVSEWLWTYLLPGVPWKAWITRDWESKKLSDSGMYAPIVSGRDSGNHEVAWSFLIMWRTVWVVPCEVLVGLGVSVRMHASDLRSLCREVIWQATVQRKMPWSWLQIRD